MGFDLIPAMYYLILPLKTNVHLERFMPFVSIKILDYA